MEFGTVAGSTTLFADTGGIIELLANHTISGSGFRHIGASSGGAVLSLWSSITITLTGKPAFSNAFAFVEEGGSIGLQQVTFSGSGTGKRFHVMTGGVIATSTENLSLLPGNSAGTLQSAGSYDNYTGVLNEADQTVAGGARVPVLDLGNTSGTTKTPDPGDRPMQKCTNNGTWTLAPGTNALLVE